jgi:hypothetical protein
MKDYLRWKLLECRISSIDEKIDKLKKLSLFFQIRFDDTKTGEICNKIEYLYKRKAELMAGFQYGS